MKLNDAVKALFDNGTVGAKVITNKSLPREIFPDADTWNHLDTVSEEIGAELRAAAFNSPTETNTFLKVPKTNTLSSAFLNLNASAVRFSPNHRVWTSDDVFAAHQRLAPGCSFMVLRLYCGDGKFSPPFLALTGPIATPLLGEQFDTRTLFGLGADDPLPAKDLFTLPETLSITSVSLMANSRSWVSRLDNNSPENALENFRAEGCTVTILDSSKLHNTFLAYDNTNASAHDAADDEDFQTWNLSLPATVREEDSTVAPDSELHAKWTRIDPVPPKPCFCQATWNPWTMPDGMEEPEDFSSSRETYKPFSSVNPRNCPHASYR
jgi:hypothetical protein